jgi:hypothetical protein
MSKQLSKDTKNIYVYETKNIHLYFLLLGGGLLFEGFCPWWGFYPGRFCPGTYVQGAFVLYLLLLYFRMITSILILRISDLVNVSGMVGLQKITTDYSSGPLIQCVK